MSTEYFHSLVPRIRKRIEYLEKNPTINIYCSNTINNEQVKCLDKGCAWKDHKNDPKTCPFLAPASHWKKKHKKK